MLLPDPINPISREIINKHSPFYHSPYVIFDCTHPLKGDSDVLDAHFIEFPPNWKGALVASSMSQPTKGTMRP